MDLPLGGAGVGGRLTFGGVGSTIIPTEEITFQLRTIISQSSCFKGRVTVRK